MIGNSQEAADKAFVGFFERHNMRLQAGARRLASYVRDPAVTKGDILSEAVLRAYKAWNELDSAWDDERRIAWVLTIMQNVAFERRRAAAHRAERDGDDLEELANRDVFGECFDDPTAEAVEARISLDRLSLVLDELPVVDRQLWTTYRSGAKISALARLKGCPQSTIRSRLSRIDAKIAKGLSRGRYRAHRREV